MVRSRKSPKIDLTTVINLGGTTMTNRNFEFTFKNISYYFLGFFILGMGVTTLLRSRLGAGAWDNVTYNLSVLLNLTLGTTSLVIAIIVMAIVLIGTKKWKLLLMVIPIFFVAVSIDLWDIIILGDFRTEGFLMQALFYVMGALTIPLGLALIVTSKFPAFVFDELMIMIMNILKTEKVVIVRVGIEVFGIVLAIGIGFMAGIGFGSVNYGSILMAVVLGPLLGFYLKILKGKTNEET